MIDFFTYSRRRLIRKIFKDNLKPNHSDYNQIILTKYDTHESIKNFILDDKPRLICRLGSGELNVIKHYEQKKDYNKYEMKNFMNNAGFFPIDRNSLDTFSKINIDAIKLSDQIGVWFNEFEDKLINKYAPNATISLLGDLSSPYFSDNPWSEALKNKSVLVIHPFEESINEQYFKYREHIFEDKRILPSFDLQTIRAVQTMAGNNHNNFKNWFEALEFMKREIDNRVFDIAIIGAGAYGLPLAAYVKEIGKKAIHLGGATQILFGIKGKRWENRDDFNLLFNSYWINPLNRERPINHTKVESGCYW